VKRVVHRNPWNSAKCVMLPVIMIAPNLEGRATPLCYASSEPLEA
jgi:hypothetical protein